MGFPIWFRLVRVRVINIILMGMSSFPPVPVAPGGFLFYDDCGGG